MRLSVALIKRNSSRLVDVSQWKESARIDVKQIMEKCFFFFLIFIFAIFIAC